MNEQPVGELPPDPSPVPSLNYERGTDEAPGEQLDAEMLAAEALYAQDGQEAPLTWQASEYVHHHKGPAWYAGLAGVMAVLLGVAVYFHLWLSVGVFLAMGAAIAVYAHKPPRVLTYQLDDHRVTIEGRAFPYAHFRSFAVLSDTEWHAIDLEPTQRFMPRLTLLFSDLDFEAIVGHLSLHLPRTDRKPDMIERATRYLRF